MSAPGLRCRGGGLVGLGTGLKLWGGWAVCSPVLPGPGCPSFKPGLWCTLSVWEPVSRGRVSHAPNINWCPSV